MFNLSTVVYSPKEFPSSLTLDNYEEFFTSRGVHVRFWSTGDRTYVQFFRVCDFKIIWTDWFKCGARELQIARMVAAMIQEAA